MGVLLLSGVATAAVRPVCATCPYGSVDDAVAAAAPGDEIRVLPGTWTSTVAVAADLTFTAPGGAAVTTWIASGAEALRVTGGVVTVRGFTVVPGERAFEVAGGALVLDDVVVAGATGGPGVGVRVVTGSLQASDSSFTDLVSTVDGGAVTLAPGTSGVFERVVFQGNQAAGGGGAIYADEATLELVDCTVSGGAADHGAGIAAVDSDLWSDGTLFQDNAAINTGGALHVEGGAWVDRAGTFLFNHADNRGGAALVATDAEVDVEGSWFESNTSGEGATFNSYLGTGALYVRASTFLDNVADLHGGALHGEVSNAALVFEDNLFVGNEAGIGGGALTSDRSTDFRVVRNRFCANRALSGVGGGAALLYKAGAARSEWTNNVFLNNTSGSQGGALAFLSGSHATVHNNTFLDNAGVNGGAIVFGVNGFDLRNNLVAGTTAGSGVVASGGLVAAADFNLWWDNVPMDRVGVSAAPGDVSAAPELLGWTADGDCLADVVWPAAGSPAIDAGDPALLDPDGSRSDVGASGGPGADPALYLDADGDGFVAALDCDDAEPAAWTGALEVAFDGVDNDCDGVEGITLDPPSWIAGVVSASVVRGVEPGATVRLYQGRAPGAGSCPPFLFGGCLDVTSPRLLASATASADGVAALSLIPSAALAGRTVWVQAVASTPSRAQEAAPVAVTLP
jgi:predicted outer membrane repeat protein